MNNTIMTYEDKELQWRSVYELNNIIERWCDKLPGFTEDEWNEMFLSLFALRWKLLQAAKRGGNIGAVETLLPPDPGGWRTRLPYFLWHRLALFEMKLRIKTDKNERSN